MSRIAIVEGVRTPFIKSGTLFNNLPAYELGRIAVRELLERTELDPKSVDEVIIGCVANPPESANIARIISLKSGIPKEKTAYTVSRNCASGFESITSGAEKITTGQADVIIAGGAESMSNIPFFFQKEGQEWFTKLSRAKNILQKLYLLARIRPSLFKPRIGLQLGLTDPVCGLNMGQTAEILAKEFGITRREQDEFALQSHKKAIAGKEKLAEEIVPVYLPPDYRTVITSDNGPRQDQTIEALGRLRPYFDRYTGTVTVGNSCQVTDGAAAVLLMPEENAKEPLGYIRGYAYTGLEPHRMGMGPAYVIPKVLEKTGLTLKDIQLIEINEAFAVQVLACLKTLDTCPASACRGGINPDILNVNGGAIALGHPVGVTGTRLVITLLKEMRRRNLNLGLAALCVGGGMGGTVIVER